MALPNRSDANSVIHPEISIKLKVKTVGSTLDRAVLHDFYVKKGYSQRDLAALFESSKSTIRDALERFGLLKKCRNSKNASRNSAFPFGKKLIDRMLVDDDKEQEVLKQIIAMHRPGDGNAVIAWILNKNEILARMCTGCSSQSPLKKF